MTDILISAQERIFPFGGNIHMQTRGQEEKPVHYHDFFELVIIGGGGCTHWVEGERYPIQRGDIFLVPPGMRHAYLQPKNLCLTNIMYTTDALDKYQAALEQIPGYLAMFRTEPSLRLSTEFKAHMTLSREQQEILDQTLVRWEEEIRHPQAAHQLLLEIRLLDVIIFCARHFGQTQGQDACRRLLLFSKMENFINQNFMHDIGRDDIMRSVSVSSSTGTALFREFCHQPPMRYLLNVRLANACRLLRGGDRSVTDIGFACGFRDSNYFSVCFHRQFGCSPREYRNRPESDTGQA
ncbi:MAG: helix-turn-helix domain-containing protein [Victivallales bacterium]|nr:helix-turn-helix domain-containing protein [Victivallales bacterium]